MPSKSLVSLRLMHLLCIFCMRLHASKSFYGSLLAPNLCGTREVERLFRSLEPTKAVLLFWSSCLKPSGGVAHREGYAEGQGLKANERLLDFKVSLKIDLKIGVEEAFGGEVTRLRHPRLLKESCELELQMSLWSCFKEAFAMATWNSSRMVTTTHRTARRLLTSLRFCRL